LDVPQHQSAGRTLQTIDPALQPERPPPANRQRQRPRLPEDHLDAHEFRGNPVAPGGTELVADVTMESSTLRLDGPGVHQRIFAEDPVEISVGEVARPACPLLERRRALAEPLAVAPEEVLEHAMHERTVLQRCDLAGGWPVPRCPQA